jgi:FixJ family two-component response regulator
VFIVDDHRSVCKALKRLLATVGLKAQTFGSAQEFMSTKRPDVPSCLVLDVRLPGRSGLDLQRELVKMAPDRDRHYHGVCRHLDDGADREGRSRGVSHETVS